MKLYIHVYIFVLWPRMGFLGSSFRFFLFTKLFYHDMYRVVFFKPFFFNCYLDLLRDLNDSDWIVYPS
jgi:hypothetical protein